MPRAGRESQLNTTTTPLTGAATYTGTGELNDYPQVGVFSFADVAGTLYFDWSVDGTNWHAFPTAGFACSASIPEFHTAVKLGRYFRARYINGSSAQSTFRLTSYFGDNFLPSNSPVNQSIGVDNDAVVVRPASNQLLDVARGFIGGQSGVSKFGANPNVSASSTEDIIYTGVINLLQAATTVRIKAGGDSNDDSSGTGARAITVEGLDENWAVATENITTNGASASTATTTTFTRVFRAYVTDVGTYGVANTGNVVIENGSGGTDLVTIEAGLGQTQTSAYTVPAGKTAYLIRMRVGSTSAKASDISFWQRRNADDVTVPFTGKRLIRKFLGVTGSRSVDFQSYPSFPAKTDLWGTVTTGSGAAGSVEIAYDLILVDD